ncbi:MAG: hypothetical protein ACRDJV_00465 [Actinomycetota bacterium]
MSAGASVPTGTTLDQIAPTIAEIIGLRRAHPEVRSGTAIPGIVSGEPPRLVLEVVLKGAGTSTLEEGEWPQLRALMGAGAATTAARVPSLPLDPAAIIATIGTGGTPRQHGITGTQVRSDTGRLVAAWSRRAPPSIIATLADDLDEGSDQEPHIGLIADSPSDRGLVGGDWYVDNDKDDVIVTQDVAGAARRLLRRGYGRDDVPDLLGVSIAAEAGTKDAELGNLIRAARAASGNSLLIVVAGTGGAKPDPEAVGSGTLVDALERETGTGLVEAVAVGGVFIDQTELAAQQVTEEQIGRALRSLEDERGNDLVADAFAGIAVSFARYC